ncbi:gluconokinase [Paenarthrobacter ureafaciens]|uniref:gluconokinase n=1 Tax=Paenarthrobacter TaxID=1742992 RepID=UPI0022323A48|nr:gluconokinase [Paenarthrobacter sp. PAE-2]MCW3768434.1 gluconokinase [Paenarthrobacter sp. PAE-2]
MDSPARSNNVDNIPPLVIMGVSGCGKSTIGALLGAQLGVTFADGDDYHPSANKLKMREGVPLTDDDRWPWLAEIGKALAGSAAGGPAIVACSALKRTYRDFLRSYAPDAVFVHLTGSAGTISERINARVHEYMPATLLASQLETLEAPEADERHISVAVNNSPDWIVGQVLEELGRQQLVREQLGDEQQDHRQLVR